MITIKAEYTDTLENIAFFAQAKGYQPTKKVIQEVQVGTDNDGNPIIENQQVEVEVNINDFVADIANQALLGLLSEPIELYIKSQTREAMQTQIESQKEQLKERLNVEVTETT